MLNIVSQCPKNLPLIVLVVKVRNNSDSFFKLRCKKSK